MQIPQKIYIKKINDGYGYPKNDLKYIGPFHNKVGHILFKFEESDTYLTDFFNPEFINLKNDYIHYGFLIVTNENIGIINDD